MIAPANIAKRKAREAGACGQKESNMFNIIEMQAEGNASSDLRRENDFIQQKINRGAVRQFAEPITITPKIAAVLLARNPKHENRNLNMSRVNTYASDMRQGLWDGLNGQTIVISKDGYLNDGQHRLNAIIAADAVFDMLCVFGAERDSRLTLDQNRARTPGDYVAMTGIANGNNIAAAARILYAYEHTARVEGNWTNSVKVSKRALHNYIMNNSEMLEWSMHIASIKGAASISPPARLAAVTCILCIGGARQNSVEKFMRALINGDALGRTDPAFIARERLIFERLRGKVPPERVVEIIVRAWNAHSLGKRMTRMALNGRIPDVVR